jgi:hypothetical protein
MHQVLVYDDVNVLGGSRHIVKKTQALIVASMGSGVDVNAEKTKCMVMS